MTAEHETPSGDSSEDFATLFARQEAALSLEVGQVVKGRVIQLGADVVFVDVGGKGDAWIDRAELTDDEGRLKVALGDEVEATVVSTGGDGIQLSSRLRQGAQTRQALAAAAETGIPVEGKVAGVIKGGYEVTVAGVRAFCPFSQMDLRRTETPDDYVGRVFEFRVITFGERGRNVVVSRRRILEEQAAKAAEETRKKIAPGAVLTGTVVSLADFGAFVDLGGIQGLIPVSEISHSRVGRPADRLSTGEAVTVKIVRVDDEKGKITLSLKALEGDPWLAVAGKLRARQIVRGRAVRATEFGIFVELLPGVDGLLHTTEVPRSRQGALREAATSGGEVDVIILGIDPEKRRVALALAPEGAVPGDQLESDVVAGAVRTGTVEKVEVFGVFVRLAPGQVGLIPNAELGSGGGPLGSTRGGDPRKAFPVGSEVKVLVVSIDEGGRRISLSHAKALAHEEQAETQDYLRGAKKEGFGTLGERFRQARRT